MQERYYSHCKCCNNNIVNRMKNAEYCKNCFSFLNTIKKKYRYDLFNRFLGYQLENRIRKITREYERLLKKFKRVTPGQVERTLRKMLLVRKYKSTLKRLYEALE